MARLNTVDPASATGETKDIFEGPLKGMHFNMFKALANSPAALNFYLGSSGALKKASLSAKEQEVATLAISQKNECGYCLAAHTALGKNAGLSEEQTVAARKGGSLGDAKLDALAAFALAVHEKKGFVDDSDLQAFRSAGYNDGAVAEVVAVYALSIFTNYFNHVAEPEVDFPAAPSI